MQGVGLGTLKDHLVVLKEKGATLYASGKSAAARGITKEQLEVLGFTPATPNKLVELTFEADRVLIY
jgi:sulfur relay (sulfurtransferase) complex TusBCD TusD component (DsrE family)